MTSLTSSLSLTGAYTHPLSVGSLSPMLSVMHVHEFANDGRRVEARVAYTRALAGLETVTLPTQRIVFRTDDPDRDFFLLRGGLIAALDFGLTMFVEFEAMAGHAFLDSRRVTGGAILSF